MRLYNNKPLQTSGDESRYCHLACASCVCKRSSVCGDKASKTQNKAMIVTVVKGPKAKPGSSQSVLQQLLR